MPSSRIVRWNPTTHIWELSTDFGATFVDLPLNASVLNEGSISGSVIPNLDASKITTGTLATARLGSGSASASKFLRGDQTWAVLDIVWPVGSVFLSVVSTNPNTLLGFGTWAAFGTGRTPVAIDTGQTEFDTVEKTGGEKTHTLTSTEMPVHTHTQNAHSHTISDPGHTHNWNSDKSGVGGGVGPFGIIDNSHAEAGYVDSNTTGITGTANATAVNQNAGSGGAHNNLQPYIVVYMWKRTA